HTASACVFRNKSKKVSFSEFATNRVYITGPNYEDQKSYSSADQNIFRQEAVHEAFRIHRMISSCPGRAGFAFKQLMEQGLLTMEELLGIEHLVSMNAEQAYRKRRSYINFVLGMQKLLLEKNKENVNVEELAADAIKKSAKMVEKARLRAALAL
ncbi:hypothetical protein ACHAW6_005461, partial [Cyclotella cf. meneghiniana]